MQILVHISDMKLSATSGDVLVTHSLGSCLGLTAYDPVVRVAGLIHCLLPRHGGNPRAKDNPAMFVSSGVPAMMRELFALGAKRSRIVIKAAGCARMMGVLNQFDTGAKNLEALEGLLKKNEMELAARDVGGSIPRTMSIAVGTGEVLIRSMGKEWVL